MGKKLTNEEVIKAFREVHGEKYDYSKVDYQRMHDKVTIICPRHGEFRQEPHCHLKGQGCPKCGVESRAEKRLDTCETFIEKARKKHGDKYDYSKVNYVDSNTKVIIICPHHGEFEQTPNAHLCGKGCPTCKAEKSSRYKRSTLDEFIEKAKKVHGDKYDYSKAVYINNRTRLTIICSKHGEFEQTPDSHLHGRGCPKCSAERANTQMSTEEFIEKARKVHGDYYDYSKTEYNGCFEYVTIICPKHGEFRQKASYHLSGNGCPKCGYETVAKNLSSDRDEFIKRAKEIHGNRYDYSKVEYINNHTKVCVICPRHGEFWVTPYNHLFSRSGCPNCSRSKLEEELENELIKCGVEFEKQKGFNWLRNDITNYPMRYDFYLPKQNIAIECQGQQHFTSGGIITEETFKNTLHRDKVKNKLSMENGIKLLYYVPKEFKNKVGVNEIYNETNVFVKISQLKKRFFE